MLLQNREDFPLRILITNMRKILYRNRKLRASIRSSKQKDYKVSIGPAWGMQKRGGRESWKKEEKKKRGKERSSWQRHLTMSHNSSSPSKAPLRMDSLSRATFPLFLWIRLCTYFLTIQREDSDCFRGQMGWLHSSTGTQKFPVPQRDIGGAHDRRSQSPWLSTGKKYVEKL